MSQKTWWANLNSSLYQICLKHLSWKEQRKQHNMTHGCHRINLPGRSFKMIFITRYYGDITLKIMK